MHYKPVLVLCKFFFLLHGCYVRVLNEKYIQAQENNNSNRTNSMTHIYIFYLSSLHLIELEKGEREKERKAEARITRERKWAFFFFYIFFWTIPIDFFFLRICLFLSSPLLLPLCAITWVVCFLILCNHPSIYISIFRQSRERDKEKRKRTKHYYLY